ncbi:MAG: DUF349 domain-containing protein, partial [Desulfobulbaceae bacterium]|nr:DUF349 domain-containing protein [Desulfobulbaceae bacterium]
RNAIYDAQGLEAKRTALAAISTDELLAEIVLSDLEPEIRQAAIEKIGNQAVLAELATKNCGKGPALAAIDKIDDESLLRLAARSASNRVARARAQAKLEEIETARNKPDPETERKLELADLMERVRALTEAIDAEAALNECRLLQRRWREIAEGDLGSAEFEQDCVVIRNRQQEHAAKEAAQRAEEDERNKRLTHLQQILAEIEILAGSATGDEESRFETLKQQSAEIIQEITPPVPDTILLRYKASTETYAESRILAAQEKEQEVNLLHHLDSVASLIELLDLEPAIKELAEAQRTFDNWRPVLINRKQVAERLTLLRELQQAGYARRDEVERMRLESNWQRRQELLAEAKTLLSTDDVRVIEKRFTELKTLWQQPVDLPAGTTDLDPEFAEVSTTVEERLDVAEKEASWLRWQNKNLKMQVITEAEALEGESDLHRVFKKIKELQEQWRIIGPAPAKDEPVLWRKFHEATDRNFTRCREFFQQLDATAEHNLQEKIGLRDEATACQDSSEWQKTAEFIKALQARWKAIGRGPQDKEQEVYAAFRGACDHFFGRRKVHHAELDHERQANLGSKEALCQEAEALADQPDIEHKIKFQELQTSWKSIGPVPRDQEEAIWQRFRLACDRYYGWLDSLRPENFAIKEALCIEVEELTAQAGPDTNFTQVAKKVVGLQRRWKEIGPVPKEVQDAVWQRFKGCCDAFFEVKARQDEAIDQQRPHNQAEKEALLARVRELSAAPSITKETVREIITIQEAWQRVGLAAKDQEPQLQKDFKSSCDAFFKERREAFQAIDELHRENLKKKEALCLRLEILAGITPQAVVQTQEKQVGMTLAEQLKVAFETNFVLAANDEQSRKRRAKDEISGVSLEWQLIGPVPREHEHLIRKRYNEGMAGAAKLV